MISPEEIKNQALKWWGPFLQSKILGEPFFPKTIDRIGKIKSGHITQRFELLQQEIESLYFYSKNQTGTGYLVKTAERTFRRIGNHQLPDAIVFETEEDYITVIGKKKECDIFLINCRKIVTSIPMLCSWAQRHCLWLTESHINWDDVLKVCQYFISTPKPELYLRQLPIEVHTKFIEENSTLLQSLLDFLIPDHIRNVNQKRFAERYFLQYDTPLIRVRFLDDLQRYNGQLSDISIPLSDFEKIEITTENVLITENKMNFLTLPPITSTIAIWSGGGFNISYLRNTRWLSNKNIFYWGDIDEHGFQILHQLRTYYSHAISVMMDKHTYDQFHAYAVNGSRNKSETLTLLTQEENELFKFLKNSDNKNRLEQEKIPQKYVDNYLNNFLLHLCNHNGADQ